MLDAPMFTGNRVHKAARHAREQRRHDARWLDSEDPLVVANAMRIIIARALKMLKAPIEAQGAAFERTGGSSERWVARRLASREGNAPGGPRPEAPSALGFHGCRLAPPMLFWRYRPDGAWA